MNTDPSLQPSDNDLYTRSASRLATLFFPTLDEVGQFESVSADELPDRYRTLLAHHNHMTVALESFHRSLVNVQALAEWCDDVSYARCSRLSRQSDGTIVQFGIMRIWLADLPAAARAEIAAKRTPLGRVLIEHNVLREVELITLWRITPGHVLREHLELKDETPLLGGRRKY